MQRWSEAPWIGHQPGQHRAQQAVSERPAIGVLDMGAGVIDEVHVVDAGRARRHAGKARQAAVDMPRHLCRRRPVLLQHLLDQVNATARRIELVAIEQVSRTGRGAETAMHAGAQNLVRLGGVRIGKLGQGEIRLHRSHPCPHAPGIEHALRIEAASHALGQCREHRRFRRKDVDRGAHRDRSADQRRMTAIGGDGRMHERRVGVVRRRHSRPDKPAGPIVEQLRIRRGGECLPDNGASRWRGRNSPNVAFAGSTVRRKRRHVADRPPQRARGALRRAWRAIRTAPAGSPARFCAAPPKAPPLQGETPPPKFAMMRFRRFAPRRRPANARRPIHRRTKPLPPR